MALGWSDTPQFQYFIPQGHYNILLHSVHSWSFILYTVECEFYTNHSQKAYYKRNNPLVKGVLPIFKGLRLPGGGRNYMWGPPFYQGIISVVTWVPQHIHRLLLFRCFSPGPHLFPCSSIYLTKVVCIVLYCTLMSVSFTLHTLEV